MIGDRRRRERQGDKETRRQGDRERLKPASLHPLSLSPCLLVSLSLLAAAPPPDWQTLLRQGDAAYGRGDYAAAAALYEQAQDRATDPGLAAMDFAAATIRLAEASEADRARLAQEAEEAYRCCTGPGDPRRPRALYGLGDALMLKADGRDADALEAAVAAYRQCLAAPNLDAGLADDARHNLERSRLLLLQIPPRPPIPRTSRRPATARPSRGRRRTRGATRGRTRRPTPPPSG